MTRRRTILIACVSAASLALAFWAGRATAPKPPPARDFWDAIDAQRAAIQKAEPDAFETVYVTRSGTKYHREGCQYTRTGATAFSKTAARAKGLAPCSKCNP